MAHDRLTPPIAVSCGEPAGIGPDIILTAFAKAQAGELTLPPFVVFGDPGTLAARAEALGLTIDLAEIDNLARLHPNSLNDRLTVCPVPVAAKVEMGVLNPQNGAAVIGAIDQSVAAVAGGRARALVTAPIHKAALYEVGFNHPGHTEYLGALAKQHWPDQTALPVMMIAGPDLSTVPVTIHCPLADVADKLTPDLLRTTIQIVARDMRYRLGFTRPRLAVAGLNPHAGESGKIGLEDDRIIRPIVAAFAAQGLDIRGPLPADTMFHKEARACYDVAICMYHDQALIPAKMLAFHEGVNVTLGLPFVRTSPDHGTALSLAGTGKAHADSFIAAMKRADELSATASSTLPDL